MSCHSSGGTSAYSAAGGGSPVVMTDAQYNALYNAQNITPALQKSFDKYTSASKEPGTLYSISQNMNYALAHDLPMTTVQKKTYQNLMGAMQEIGGNYTVSRYDHKGLIDSLLSQAGLTNGYENYSIDQLQSAANRTYCRTRLKF